MFGSETTEAFRLKVVMIGLYATFEIEAAWLSLGPDFARIS